MRFDDEKFSHAANYTPHTNVCMYLYPQFYSNVCQFCRNTWHTHLKIITCNLFWIMVIYAQYVALVLHW